MKNKNIALQSAPPQKDATRLLLSSQLLEPNNASQATPSKSIKVLGTQSELHSASLQSGEIRYPVWLQFPQETPSKAQEQKKRELLFLLQKRLLRKSFAAYQENSPLPLPSSPWSSSEETDQTLPPLILCQHAPYALQPSCGRCAATLHSEYLLSENRLVLSCPHCEKRYDEEEQPTLLRNTLQHHPACQDCPHKKNDTQTKCLHSASFFSFSRRPYLLQKAQSLSVANYLHAPKRSLDEIFSLACVLVTQLQKAHQLGICALLSPSLNDIWLEELPNQTLLPRYPLHHFTFDEADLPLLYQAYSTPFQESDQKEETSPFLLYRFAFSQVSLEKNHLHLLLREKRHIDLLVKKLQSGDRIGFLSSEQQNAWGAFQKNTQRSQEESILTLQRQTNPTYTPSPHGYAFALCHTGYQEDLFALREILWQAFSQIQNSSLEGRIQSLKQNYPLLSDPMIEQIRSLLDFWLSPANLEKTRQQDALDQLERLSKKLSSLHQEIRLPLARAVFDEKNKLFLEIRALQEIAKHVQDKEIEQVEILSLEEDILLSDGQKAIKALTRANLQTRLSLQKKIQALQAIIQNSSKEHYLSDREVASYSASLSFQQENTRTLVELQEDLQNFLNRSREIRTLLHIRRAEKTQFAEALKQFQIRLSHENVKRTQSADIAKLQKLLEQANQHLAQTKLDQLDHSLLTAIEIPLHRLEQDAQQQKIDLRDRLSETLRELALLPSPKSFREKERLDIEKECHHLQELIDQGEKTFLDIKESHKKIKHRINILKSDLEKKQNLLQKQEKSFQSALRQLQALPSEQSAKKNAARLRHVLDSLHQAILTEDIALAEQQVDEAKKVLWEFLQSIHLELNENMMTLFQRVKSFEQAHNGIFLEHEEKKGLSSLLDAIKAAASPLHPNQQINAIRFLPNFENLIQEVVEHFISTYWIFQEEILKQGQRLLCEQLQHFLSSLRELQKEPRLQKDIELLGEIMQLEIKTKDLQHEAAYNYKKELWVDLPKLESKKEEIEKNSRSLLKRFGNLFFGSRSGKE